MASVLYIISNVDPKGKFNLTLRNEDPHTLDGRTIKKKIRQVTGIPEHKQIIKFKGRVLEDWDTGFQLGLRSGETLILEAVSRQRPQHYDYAPTTNYYPDYENYYEPYPPPLPPPETRTVTEYEYIPVPVPVPYPEPYAVPEPYPVPYPEPFPVSQTFIASPPLALPPPKDCPSRGGRCGAPCYDYNQPYYNYSHHDSYTNPSYPFRAAFTRSARNWSL